jgi:hypothetical protein
MTEVERKVSQEERKIRRRKMWEYEANRRVNMILISMEKLGDLAKEYRRQYKEEDIKDIMNALNDGLDNVDRVFALQFARGGFKL